MHLTLNQKEALMYGVLGHGLLDGCDTQAIHDYYNNEPVRLSRDTFIKLYHIDKAIDWLYEHIEDKLDMVFIRALYSQYKTLTAATPNPNLTLPLSCYAPALNSELNRMRESIATKFLGIGMFCQDNNLFGEDSEVVDYMLHLKAFIDTDEELDGLVSFYQDQLANG